MENETPFSLAGMRILITGANGGIGQATSRLCAKLGGEMLLVDLKAPTELAREIGAEAIACDMSDRTRVEAMAEWTGRVDAVVDLAALCPFDDWNDENWNDVLMDVMSVNVGGPLNLMRAYFPMMMEHGFGRAVLVGSLAGRTGGLRAAPHYAASKGAIHALVRWFAQRGTQKNVLINGISPGTTDTPMSRGHGYDPNAFPLRRLAYPEEMAGPIAFLLSPASSFISGVVLDVNGGIHYS